MNIALIKNNKVENIIVAEMSFAQQLGYDEIIDTEGLTIGIGWTKVNNIWIAPIVVVPESVIEYETILTPYAFLKRFTPEERKRIKAETLVNPDVEDLWTMFNKAQEMDLNDTDTIEGVNALEYFTLLDAGRATVILTKYPI